MDARLDALDARLRSIRVAVRRRPLEDAALKEQLAKLPPLQAEIAELLGDLTPRLEDAQARLAELGPAPAAGQPAEGGDVADDRARLLRLQARLDGAAKRARLLSVEAEQLSETLSERLQQNFSSRLWARSRSALEPALWVEAAMNLPEDAQRLGAAVADHLGRATRPPGAAILLLGLAVFLLAPARILLDRLGRKWAATLVPGSALRRSALALWLTFVGCATPLLAAIALREAIRSIAPMQPAVGGLAAGLATALFFGSLIHALGIAILAPGRPSWRLAPIPDHVVDHLAPYPALVGLVVGLVSFVTRAADVLEVSAPMANAVDCLSVLVEVAAVGAGLLMLGRTRGDREAARGEAGTETERQARSRWPWVLSALAAWLALAAALAAVTAGYLALATFIMRELIWITLVLASLFLLMRFVDDLCQALFSADTLLGRLIETAVGLSSEALEQIGVLLSGLLRLGLLVVGWAAVIAPFGASTREIFGRLTSAELVFKLGQLSISPGLIFGAAAVFLIGLGVTRLIRSWLETTYLPKTRIDVGVRTSITAGLTYLGVLAAVLMTCAYLGLSLDRIALFASALSVGVGFGLQAVISNFVSGLILLAERPVKVGDWVSMGDLEGDIRRIHIRATEIEMGDRSKLIVPNSDLISKAVRNVTPAGGTGQVKIVLKVANDADPVEVRDLLLAGVAAHPELLPLPSPGVYLTNVPDGALEFTVVAAVASPRHVFRVKSELLFAVVTEMRARGVHLANSSAVVHLAAPSRET